VNYGVTINKIITTIIAITTIIMPSPPKINLCCFFLVMIFLGYTPTLIVNYGGIWGENYWYEIGNVWEDSKIGSFIDLNGLQARY
jgi:hypothetical protein